MSYRVRITKQSSNKGPLGENESLTGLCTSLPAVSKAFIMVTTDGRLFNTSVVKKIKYSNGDLHLDTLNSQYVVEIFSTGD